MIWSVLTIRARLYLSILSHNCVKLAAKSATLDSPTNSWDTKGCLRVEKNSFSRPLPFMSEIYMRSYVFRQYMWRSILDCYISEPLISDSKFESSRSLLLLVLVGIGWRTAPDIKVKIIQKSKLIWSKFKDLNGILSWS